MGKSVKTNVPRSQVGKVVQDYIDYDNKTKVVCTEQADGTWTIEAEDS